MYSQQLLVRRGSIILLESPKRDSQVLSVSCIESLVRDVIVSTSDTAQATHTLSERSRVARIAAQAFKSTMKNLEVNEIVVGYDQRHRSSILESGRKSGL